MEKQYINPYVLTEEELAWLLDRLRNNDAHAFYTWRGKWLKVRAKVLRLDKNECQSCKALGKYKRATHVHHIKHLKDRPDLALSIWIEEHGVWKRQLISLCQECHELEHPERMRKYIKKKAVTQERWD